MAEIYTGRNADLGLVISHYARNGLVFIGPELAIMAESRGYYCAPGEIDTWFIEYFHGSIGAIVGFMPFWLPFVAFERKGRLKVYSTATIVNRVK